MHSIRLLLVLIGLLASNVIETKLVDVLGSGDNTEPVTKLLLLEVLLCPGRYEY